MLVNITMLVSVITNPLQQMQQQILKSSRRNKQCFSRCFWVSLLRTFSLWNKPYRCRNRWSLVATTAIFSLKMKFFRIDILFSHNLIAGHRSQITDIWIRWQGIGECPLNQVVRIYKVPDDVRLLAATSVPFEFKGEAPRRLPIHFRKIIVCLIRFQSKI